MSKALSFAVELFLPDLSSRRPLRSRSSKVGLHVYTRGYAYDRAWFFSLRHLAYPYHNFYGATSEKFGRTFRHNSP